MRFSKSAGRSFEVYRVVSGADATLFFSSGPDVQALTQPIVRLTRLVLSSGGDNNSLSAGYLTNPLDRSHAAATSRGS